MLLAIGLFLLAVGWAADYACHYERRAREEQRREREAAART